MPPRLRIAPKRILPTQTHPTTPFICHQCRRASLATATAAVQQPPPPPPGAEAPPIARYPPTQPPSYKRPEYRKTQLHRQYQSLLRSTPFMVLFQHNNLKSTEWMGIRRELAIALERVDEEAAKRETLDGGAAVPSKSMRIGSEVKIVTIQTKIFASALKIVELYNPANQAALASSSEAAQQDEKSSFSHGLSAEAYTLAKERNSALQTGLEPLLSGPLALLIFPTVSPAHLAAALSILAPNKQFPAPKRRTSPGYFEPPVQAGLQKLMLLAARVEGTVFDHEGTRWVGGIEGGIDGLRGRLVSMLQGVGAGVTGTLEAASRSLYVSLEGRRGMLEEEEKGGKGGEGAKEGE